MAVLDSDIIVITSDDPINEEIFVGYGYIDGDIVVGNSGARHYREARGRAIPGDEHGCYLQVTRQNSNLLIANDFVGSMPIFYYQDGRFWAVSNSLHRLAQHLKALGRRLTANPPQVDAWNLSGAFGSQLQSFETVIKEIGLLPSFCSLEASARGLTMRPRSRPPAPGYNEGLSEFLAVWQARFQTLLAQNVRPLVVDISGGIDSRSVLGMVLLAVETLGCRALIAPRYRTSERPDQARDREVATALASSLGISFEGQDGKLARGERYSAQHLVEEWKDNCLGVYNTLRMRMPQEGGQRIHVGGGGGENFRSFYKQESVEQLLRSQRKDFSSSDAFKAWARAVREAISLLRSHDGNETDPLILHYREFRTRFHTGSSARVSMTAFPLQSRHLFLAAQGCSADHLSRRQIACDIMRSTCPILLDFRFDDPAKQFTAENRRTACVAPISQRGPGQVYWGDTQRSDDAPSPPPGRRRRQFRGPSIKEEMTRQLSRAETVLAGDSRAAEDVEAAKGVLAQAGRKGISERRKDVVPLYRVLLAEMIAATTVQDGQSGGQAAVRGRA